MENNYGRLNNFNGEGKEPVITTNQTGLSRMDDLLHQNDNYENGWVKHPDDEEVQFVTKAINELDPEILAAMEHLSITDEDIMPNTTADQNDKANINSNRMFCLVIYFYSFNVLHFLLQVKQKVRALKTINLKLYPLKIQNLLNE